MAYAEIIRSFNGSMFSCQVLSIVMRKFIWEGSGYTLASGSSSCAASSILVKKGLIRGDLIVHMQGGTLQINIDKDWNIRMTGEVREIARGMLSRELIEDLDRPLPV
jgi:diaminopimelate epimerase